MDCATGCHDMVLSALRPRQQRVLRDAFALRCEGMAQLRQGKYAEAIVDFDQALEFSPEDARVLMLRRGSFPALEFLRRLQCWSRCVGRQGPRPRPGRGPGSTPCSCRSLPRRDLGGLPQ
ncbi:unnamed protein product [Symbiodinium sp. CCMP2592]|nr:unnamed protein product [Symbiodinium sp. CCMP2592]